MNGPAKLGRIAVAVIVGFAAVVLGAAPARAGGLVRYENVGNPTWCMYADWYGPRLRSCAGNTEGTLWSWAIDDTLPDLVQLTSQSTGSTCLTAPRDAFTRDPDTDVINGGAVTTTYCDPYRSDQHWYVWGQNGWVVYQLSGINLCIKPVDTHLVNREYNLALATCPAENNVPNIFAWRYF